MSLRELAVKCGTSKSAIFLYEQGKRKPKYEVLEALADVFNVDMAYLMGRQEAPLTLEKPAPADGYTDVDNKALFAANLNKYMRKYNKSRRDISEALRISYYTVSDWCVGKKYPRMDKVEKLAMFFGIQKSDLIEDKTEKPAPADGYTDEERALIEAFRSLSPADRELFGRLLKRALK
jgi:transcriptional regulator with XRE-family HTH domain